MGVLKTILLVVFVIVSILLILLVLVQNDESKGMGTAFGGGQSAAFGARSASVLTKTTGFLVALFFIIAFSLGVLNKSPSDKGLKEAASEIQSVEATENTTESENWLDAELDASSEE